VRVEGHTVYLQGEITRENANTVLNELRNQTSRRARRQLSVLDLSQVTRLDSAGVGLVDLLGGGAFGRPLQVRGAQESVAEALELGKAQEGVYTETGKLPFIVRAGNALARTFAVVWDALLLGGEIFFWSMVGTLFPGGRRKGSATAEFVQTGVNAVPIVTMLALIIGVIIALQGVVQLEQFGGAELLADFSGFLSVVEFGPLVAAIIVAGRTGSAIASEVGTMNVTDELDALKSMGIRPIEYVIVPKFLAMTIGMPLLSAFAATVAMGGGVAVAYFYVGTPPASFVARSFEILAWTDGVMLIVKSVLFGWAIAVIGSYCGFTAYGGSSEVGRATTQSVVASISAIVMIDVVFSFVYIV